MKDQKTLSYINMFAVLKDLEPLCRLDDEPKALATPSKPVSIGFNVGGDGPKATFTFGGGECSRNESLKKPP